MKRRKHRYRGYSKRTIILTIALFCSLFFGLGYSLLGTSLDLSGIISVKKYDQTLYGVLEKEAKRGTNATTYTGDHKDSFTVNATKDIYYFRSNTNNDETEAATILDKWNVIFAGHCWQMYRTTDTGGVKLLYNGEVENGKCLTTRGKHAGYNNVTTKNMLNSYYYGSDYTYDKTSNLFSLAGSISTGNVPIGSYTCMDTSNMGTCSSLYLVIRSNDINYDALVLNGNSHYSQYGETKYNFLNDSLGYSGYMYNTIYPSFSNKTFNYYVGYSYSAPANGYFGTGISYNNGIYTLENATFENWTDIYQNSKGLYRCVDSSVSACSEVLYIIDGYNNSYVAFRISNGYDLGHYDDSFYLGDGINSNGDGTYTITNSVLKKRTEYSSSTFYGKYYCMGEFDTCTEPKYIYSAGNNSFNYIIVGDNYKFAKGFTFNNGVYTLNDDSIISYNYLDYSLNSYRYTCFNESGICSDLYYTYYRNVYLYYLLLNDGNDLDDEINEMLYNDDVNKYDSLVKLAADAWYKKYLLDYSSYVDDILFHSCRSISSMSGLSSEGNINRSVNFNAAYSCPNETDQFSVSNSKAQLIYPIGFLTYSEQARINNDLVMKTGNTYWTMTPSSFTGGVSIQAVSSSGYSNLSSSALYSNGIRPVIALKPGTEYVSGTGSMADPYIVA